MTLSHPHSLRSFGFLIVSLPLSLHLDNIFKKLNIYDQHIWIHKKLLLASHAAGELYILSFLFSSVLTNALCTYGARAMDIECENDEMKINWIFTRIDFFFVLLLLLSCGTKMSPTWWWMMGQHLMRWLTKRIFFSLYCFISFRFST